MSMSQGEVWLVNLDPTIGDEIRKMRPAIVVSHDSLGVLALRVVVPITGWQVMEGIKAVFQVKGHDSLGAESRRGFQ